MISRTSFSVREVTEKDRPQLANLIHFETRVHRHLDWRPPLDWIGYSPCLVAENNNGHLIGALVCPPDPPEIAWIRLFAVSSQYSITETWEPLWDAARMELNEKCNAQVAAIPLQQWFRTLLERAGFYHNSDVVLLQWQRGKPISKRRLATFSIRPMNFDDLPSVKIIDEAAFSRIWQNSLESLGLAFRQSAVATVAEDENGIAGYQISTASPMGGHLARLAVHPDMQGKDIGITLVLDMLDQFERRGALRVTVNTQEDNLTSLSLYEKVGFQRTGESYPVYQYFQEKNS